MLELKQVSKTYDGPRGTQVPVLADTTFTLASQEFVTVQGPSGCGKSTLISAIIRLLAPNAQIKGGSILFRETNLLGLESEAMRALLGHFRDARLGQSPLRELIRARPPYLEAVAESWLSQGKRA